MQIEIPRNRAALFGLGRKILNGLRKFVSVNPPAIALKQTSEANFQADYTAAASGEDAFQQARVLKAETFEQRRQAAADADAFIGQAKASVFRKLFGPRWSVEWAQVGFKNASIETPDALDGKLEVLRGMASWFTRNPDKQVTANELVITAVKAGHLEQALTAAINTVENCKSDTDEKEAARTEAEEALRKRVRVVIDELDFLLDPMDARWPVFGLNKPGETERPEAVTAVSVDVSTPRTLRLTWEPTTRAIRYKVFALVVGQDTEYELVDEVFEPEVDLTGFNGGDFVRVKIVASNGAGDSAASPEVSAQVPSVAVAA